MEMIQNAMMFQEAAPVALPQLGRGTVSGGSFAELLQGKQPAPDEAVAQADPQGGGAGQASISRQGASLRQQNSFGSPASAAGDAQDAQLAVTAGPAGVQTGLGAQQGATGSALRSLKWQNAQLVVPEALTQQTAGESTGKSGAPSDGAKLADRVKLLDLQRKGLAAQAQETTVLTAQQGKGASAAMAGAAKVISMPVPVRGKGAEEPEVPSLPVRKGLAAEAQETAPLVAAAQQGLAGVLLAPAKETGFIETPADTVLSKVEQAGSAVATPVGRAIQATVAAESNAATLKGAETTPAAAVINLKPEAGAAQEALPGQAVANVANVVNDAPVSKVALKQDVAASKEVADPKAAVVPKEATSSQEAVIPTVATFSKEPAAQEVTGSNGTISMKAAAKQTTSQEALPKEAMSKLATNDTATDETAAKATIATASFSVFNESGAFLAAGQKTGQGKDPAKPAPGATTAPKGPAQVAGNSTDTGAAAPQAKTSPAAAGGSERIVVVQQGAGMDNAALDGLRAASPGTVAGGLQNAEAKGETAQPVTAVAPEKEQTVTAASGGKAPSPAVPEINAAAGQEQQVATAEAAPADGTPLAQGPVEAKAPHAAMGIHGTYAAASGVTQQTGTKSDAPVEEAGIKTAPAAGTAKFVPFQGSAGQDGFGDAEKKGTPEQKAQATSAGAPPQTQGMGLQTAAGPEAAAPAETNPTSLKSALHESILAQIKDGVVTHDDKGNGQMSIRLNPGELGELKIQVRMDDNRLHVEVQADNKMVKDLLMSNLDSLKDSLTSKNLTMAGFDVSTGGGGFNSPLPEQKGNPQQQSFLRSARAGAYPDQGESVKVNYLTGEVNNLLDVRF